MTRGSKVSPVRICIVTVSHLAVGRAAARDDDVARVLSGLVLEDHRTHYVEIETVALAQANRLGVDVHGNRALQHQQLLGESVAPPGAVWHPRTRGQIDDDDLDTARRVRRRSMAAAI